jgi:hypothetical protein
MICDGSTTSRMLTPETRLAFQISATLPFIHRYYLAGGAGLALHLGHRFSVDLQSPSSTGCTLQAT